jgi:hypothetical protein
LDETIFPQDWRKPSQSTRPANSLPAPLEDNPIVPFDPQPEPVEPGGKRPQQSGLAAVIQSLDEAMSWVEGETRQADDLSQATQPPPGETVREQPIRSLVHETQPVTYLEIGKIEVEVVPPVKPVQTLAPPRPGPKTSGFSRTSARTFGWRQR